MDNAQLIADLFDKYLDGETSPEETAYLLSHFTSKNGQRELAELVNSKFEQGEHIDPILFARLQPMTDRVAKKLNQFITEDSHKRTSRKLWTGLIATAASIILAIGAILIYQYQANRQDPASNLITADADPGTNKATLTLANGNKINLDDATTGQLANQAGVKISKTADGQLVYSIIDDHNAPGTNNTISTPNGGQYQVILPDGTKVWLNAASSLKYPVSFAKQKQRIIELSGEAYFEVAHNPAQPFQVVTNNQTVEVLGTHFNVNSYANEKDVITTLEEGSVKVIAKNQSNVIVPGEQAVLNANGILAVRPADMETALAWKNGNIIFRSASIQRIMRQVERWYDIEVEYEGQLPERIFTGGISRSSKLSVLLAVLKDSDINFEVKDTPQGKKLIIKP